MKALLKKVFTLLVINLVQCTIDGLTYMDDLNRKLHNSIPNGEDPCNPLYWYPKTVPEYCQHKNVARTDRPVTGPMPPPLLPKPVAPPILPPMPPLPVFSPPIPIPMPLPFPAPMPPPMPVPLPAPMPGYIPAPMPGYMPAPMQASMTPPMPAPMSAYMPAPMPFSLPVIPPNVMMSSSRSTYPSSAGMFPYPTFSSPYGNQQAGMVPGIPGIVSRDGGINILPFSDAYSDLLEKRKQKIIRRKFQKFLDDYEDFSGSRHYRLRKKLRNA